jgi:hypothetical protein
MEVLVILTMLVALDILALRFGYDSRDLRQANWRELD